MKVMKAILASLLLAFVGCGAASHPVDSTATAWRIEHSNDMRGTLATTSDGIGRFAFPGDALVGWEIPLVGYVVTDYVGPRPQEITMVYRIDGNGVFNADLEGNNGAAEGCVTLPSVTLLLQKRGDDLTGEDGRWWAGTTALVNGSTVSLTVTLDPKNWTNVEGHNGATRAAEFDAATGDLAHVGMTFGGGCNYGHGVNLTSGESTFTLVRYEIK